MAAGCCGDGDTSTEDADALNSGPGSKPPNRAGRDQFPKVNRNHLKLTSNAHDPYESARRRSVIPDPLRRVRLVRDSNEEKDRHRGPSPCRDVRSSIQARR